MKKLNLDELAVESFSTAPDPVSARGTVHGHSDSWEYVYTCQRGGCVSGGQATCYGSCAGEPSCESPDCTFESCNFTCYCNNERTLPGRPTCQVQCGFTEPL